MGKKSWILVSGGTLIALLLASAIGVTAVFAQEPEPGVEPPAGEMGPGRGPGGFVGRLVDGGWETFDLVAETLGLTPVEFFTELHDGKRVEEIAEEQGVEMEELIEVVQNARQEAMRARIEQAVENGNMSQEQADWLLEGLDKGYGPMGRGGRPGGRGGKPPMEAGKR
jgi:hypothetical protein